MEDREKLERSFNPYFTGYTTFTTKRQGKNLINGESFNPYFTGYTTFTSRFLNGQ